MAVLSVQDIYKSFDGQAPVLNGISLSVEKGDVISILGPSGGGKTTLLRCMNFLERADRGRLTFDGKTYDLSAITRKEIAAIRKRTAFVFQNYNLFLNKTAIQNVMEGLVTARHMEREKAHAIATAMLEKVGLPDKADFYPNQLSGGQQQRVAIARALATDPEIIYFDEPTSALDPELTGEVLEVMRALAVEGMTTVLVTHELEFARSVSTRVLLMEQGIIVESGTAEDIFEHPTQERTRAFLRLVSGDVMKQPS